MKPKRPHEGGTQATAEGLLGESYTELRILRDRIDWLASHEHWWARALRWHRERYGPDCDCRACTWEAAA